MDENWPDSRWHGNIFNIFVEKVSNQQYNIYVSRHYKCHGCRYSVICIIRVSLEG